MILAFASGVTGSVTIIWRVDEKVAKETDQQKNYTPLRTTVTASRTRTQLKSFSASVMSNLTQPCEAG